MKTEALSLRPYARLLTMLGDQLIKNERIALVELIKNAYDADADRVEVHFEDFDEDMENNPGSRILVRDDGVGMTLDTVRTQWMNPAGPRKFLDKQQGKEKTPEKGRVIQGEKGIGRFAVLKLGKVVTVTTRPRGSLEETVLRYDFARFDDDFVSENGQERAIFLDEIRVDCWGATPEKLPGTQRGTVIEIEDLKGLWRNRMIEQLCRDVSNLTDPISRITRRKASNRFSIAIYCNGEPRSVEADGTESLRGLIEEKAVLKIQGGFDCDASRFYFDTGDSEEEISLEEAKIRGLWVWRQRFGRARGSSSTEEKFTCGDFRFHFYIFDFSRGMSGRYVLNQKQKNRLKDHRIYLYRDDVRVYPYGDPEDDWLNIDVTRGIGRAGDFFSNDQIIGWIDITQKGNPGLRDKTSREGLIEAGGEAADLMFLVRTFLSYIKQYPFARHQERQRQRNIAQSVRDEVVGGHLAELKESLEKSGHEPEARKVGKIEAEYEREKEYLSQRAEMTEDLAGVGLSVEMASHDIMLLMSRAQEIGSRVARMTRREGGELRAEVDMLLGVLQQIADGMRDVQSLFKSSQRRRKVLKVEPVLDKIHQIYSTLLEKRGIHYEKLRGDGSPLVANTTDGVVMQVLINLFDNASYWLETVNPEEREIRVVVDGDKGEMVFGDSGPGVDPEDEPYIFEPFYSGKGEEGRGLGLYIARQLLERHDYGIAAAEHHQRVLPGANFVVSFVKETQDGTQ